MNYSTPGVSVEEITTFPPSVAPVATAVPAFFGYTEKGVKNSPTRIANMIEYEQLFGGPKKRACAIAVGPNNKIAITPPTDAGQFILHPSLTLYFKNGGGPCYVVAVGNYVTVTTNDDGTESTTETIEIITDFRDGLATLVRVDEPTLILMPDAVNLGEEYYALCTEVLAHCGKLKDRFGIFDVPKTEAMEAIKATNFRANVNSDLLKYGAAYTPYLNTMIPYPFDEEKIEVSYPTTPVEEAISNNLKITYSGTGSPSVVITKVTDLTAGTVSFEVLENTLTITYQDTSLANAGVAATAVASAWDNFANKGGFNLLESNNGGTNITDSTTFSFATTNGITTSKLNTLKSSQTRNYNLIKVALLKQWMTLPPSGAIAGIYAQVDRSRGVWKAPANVSIAAIVGPEVQLTNEDQGELNIDPTSGKSINAIRNFTGKGTLVWGARTLAGNDNEWRYISVRRLFITIEESVKKASSFAVFEPNDATTWLKVKAMIDSYLYGLWQQGALAGPTPESSYFVNVGLGKTMTTDDVLNGYLIVDIGIAAVRPAEFIVLKFSHKLQEA